MLLKRINRYSALRIPRDLDYLITLENRNRIISKRKNIGKYAKSYKGIYSRVPISIVVHNGKLVYYCSNCGKKMTISEEKLCSTRYIKCTCGSLNDMKSKNTMRYYLIYETSMYNQITSRRQSNRLVSRKIKNNQEKLSKEKVLRAREPLIIVDNRKAIIPAIWKEIMQDDTLTQKEKEILCEMQMPVSKYKLLKVLGVKLDDDSKQLTDDEIREIKKATIIDVDKSESIKHYY